MFAIQNGRASPVRNRTGMLFSRLNTDTAFATLTRPVEPSTVARVTAPHGAFDPSPAPVVNAASSSRSKASFINVGMLSASALSAICS